MKIEKNLITTDAAFAFEVRDQYTNTLTIHVVAIEDDDNEDLIHYELAERGSVLMSGRPAVVEAVNRYNAIPEGYRRNAFNAIAEARKIADQLCETLREEVFSEAKGDGVY